MKSEDKEKNKSKTSHIKAAQQAAYKEMEKSRPMESAVEAFRRKPYSTGEVSHGRM